MEAAVTLTSFGAGIVGVFIVLGLVGSLLLNWLWFRPKTSETCLRQQGFKGNSYRLLMGDAAELGKASQEAKCRPISIDDDIVPRILPYHCRTIKKYGNDSFIWVGPSPFVNITNPDQIKEVLNKMYDFQKPTYSPLAKYLLCGLPMHEGEKWVKHRKIINPAFHAEKLKLMLPAFYQCCEEMINKWKAQLSERDSCELDVWPSIHSLTGDVISRTAFGSSYEDGKKIFQLQVEQAELTAKVITSFYIPGMRFIGTKRNRRMKEIEDEIQGLVRGIINSREKGKNAGEAPRDDLLGMLLESNYKEIQQHGNNKNCGMTIADIIEECKIFYFAGQETTSLLINWTLVLLSRFPHWQQRAREEVMQVFGTKKPDYDGLNRLKVVPMILYEVLRLYPPAPLLTRYLPKETKLGNLTLPAGTRIWVPVIMVHHDRELWGNDAKEFNPERFSEGVVKATNGQVSFFPFSWGPRICIGQNYAMMEAKMALSLILQNFSFELSPSYAHAPYMVLTLVPQFGTHIILHKL
ncbi:hypothetical protein L6164_018240 [Bauhinia variegata]|uniref:Uncharacterized protein n=1 Tax=Bauhinia variegata TaxID=167791 RepID=A0ACB9NB57_BAUVA|nr:hypothetical protein L6164_018240 [Bauhinia variegata]